LLFDTTLGAFYNVLTLTYLEKHIPDKFYFIFEAYYLLIKKENIDEVNNLMEKDNYTVTLNSDDSISSFISLFKTFKSYFSFISKFFVIYIYTLHFNYLLFSY